MPNSSNSAHSATPYTVRNAEILTAGRPKVMITIPVRIYADEDGDDYWSAGVAYSSKESGGFSIAQINLGHVKTEVPEWILAASDNVLTLDHGDACSKDEAEAMLQGLVDELKRRCKNVFVCTTQTQASALAVKHFPGARSRQMYEAILVENRERGTEI